MKTCFYCTETVHPQTIQYESVHAGRPVRVLGVPALVCPSCGEIYIEPEISVLIDEALGAAPPGTVVVELHHMTEA